jgi:uncharacterized protein YodC (DUF2158 family)
MNRRQEDAMAFEPGDVVFLKSGGQPMTVAAVEEDSVECIWIGEEGELFRETVPSVTLTAAAPDAIEEDDLEDASEDEEQDEEEADREDADEAKSTKRRKK